MPEHRQVIIIGSSPTGLTAAIYGARATSLHWLLRRARLQVINRTIDVDYRSKYAAFQRDYGSDLMQNFRSQAERFGASFLTQR